MVRWLGASRSGSHSVVDAAATVLGAQAGIYVLGLVASVVIARSLGPAGRGAYYLPVAAATTAVATGHLSVETANAYFFAERGASVAALSRSAAFVALTLGPGL